MSEDQENKDFYRIWVEEIGRPPATREEHERFFQELEAFRRRRRRD